MRSTAHRLRGLRRSVMGGLALVMALSGAAPAGAQTLGAVEQRLRQLEQAITRLEKRQSAPGEDRASAEAAREAAILELTVKVSAMERQLAGLTAAREADHRALASMRDQAERTRSDTETRLDALEEKLAAAALAPQATTPAATAPAARPRNPDDDLGAALGLAEQGQWANAELALDTFIANNPAHARIVEARYWLGRSLLGEGKAALAAKLFLELYEQHPDAALMPANLLGLAEALQAMGPDSAKAACDVYAQIQADHLEKLTAGQREDVLRRRIALGCGK